MHINKKAALRLLVLEPAAIVLALALVRREVWQFHAEALRLEHWQEFLLLPLSAIDGAISGACSGSCVDKPSRGKLLRLAPAIFLILYVACAALCERLSLTSLRLDLLRWFGLALVAGGVAVRASFRFNPSPFVIEAVPKGDLKTDTCSGDSGKASNRPGALVRHPEAAGALLALAGLPLVFACWLPLLSLPGIIVLLKWHIADRESFLISQFGSSYLEYRKKSWNLIPFIY